MKTDYRDTAQLYADEGFNPIPVYQDKNPALKSGLNFLYTKMEGFDERYISWGIALTCGIASDGLECIDFDKHKGQDIETIFNQFIADEHVAYILTECGASMYKTPSGGYHILYRCKYNSETKTISKYPDGDLMIEVRGMGAYIITDPTPGYELIGGNELIKCGYIDRKDRDYLIDVARSLSFVEVIDKTEQKIDGQAWGNWDEKTAWGKYNIDEADDAKKLLKDHGWTLQGERQRDRQNLPPVELWRRPGKYRGISATFGQFDNMFYCWTDALEAKPFEKEKAYSPTDILMLLKHAGDWEKTKEDLYEKTGIRPVKKTPPIQYEPDVNVLPFPVDVFPLSFQQFIDELNRTLNYKPDFLSVALMFAVATINGNKYKLRVKNGWTAATTFWFAVVGESGVMKSHPINTMVKPIKDIDKAEYNVYHDAIKGMSDDEKKKNKPVFRQILVEDFTLEAVHAIHSVNPRGLGLHKDELVGFLKDMNKYRNGSDEQFWLESFNNSSYIVNRVTKEPIMIDNIMVNIIGSVQPQVLSSVAANSDGNGLIERFLYTSSESNVYPISIDDIDIEWMDWYEQTLSQMHKHLTYYHKGNTITLEMSREALQRFIEVDAELCKIQMDDNEISGIKNYVNKIKTYMPRFALLLWLFDAFTVTLSLEAKPMPATYIDRAKRLADYFIASARKVFTDSEKRDEIDNVGRSLKARGMTKGEQILQLHSKGFKQVDIATILKTPKSYVSKIITEKKG